ncbi:putative Beta-barrel assembly-enhancing protease [Georgfuchsia toluolica]|uniref:Beta-barrel assembly-enhancing protease n=1 Tax=Georgfuchsia toluolica TaxID=424218 RepID=A0A916J7B0_9PROT|nr:putative Beta-barrel assembly-enhancing protease [Georgfuchsia toluolica]
MRKTLLYLLVLALVLPPPIFADGLPDLGESSQVELSPFAERSIGEAVMNDIRLHEPTYLDDPEIAAYLNELGHRLTAQTEDAHQEFEFFVLHDATVNAFAMPGGYIGVHSGLILLTQSESELASVLAHEISHITQHHLARQLRPQAQSQMLAMLSMAAALIAARSRPDLAQGALMAGQGAAIQTQLSYSRDFEREADRIGIRLLERAGFDIYAMETFFGRMEKNTRLYEANAQSYLMTHPLTSDRMADMANRIQAHPYHQVVDSPAYWLVRAKLTAMEGTPQEAITIFRTQINDRKFNSESAAHYGLALALSRNKNYKGAEDELLAARRNKMSSPMFETLAADLKLKQNDPAAALAILQAAQAKYPQSRAVVYQLLDTQIRNGRLPQALQLSSRELQSYTADPKLYEFQARTYAGMGKVMLEHRAQAEAYALYGQNVAAIEQLLLAQKAPDGDFYERSQVDARLRALRAIEAAKPRAEQGREQRHNWKGEHHDGF